MISIELVPITNRWRLSVRPTALSYSSHRPAFRTYTTASTATAVPPSSPYNILFCGTDTFAATSLSSLISHRSTLVSSLHVLTPPDTSQRWGATRMKISPVKQLALSHNLPHQEVPPSGMSAYTLPPDFALSSNSILLTCSFGHMIPDTLLDTFSNPWQRLNIHPSLLPQLRGAAPIQWALARRLNQSGISIQTLEKGSFDTGTIVAQQSFPFPPPPSLPNQEHQTSFLQVEKVMAQKAANLLIQTLSNLPNYWENSWEQVGEKKSFAPKLKPNFSKIKWEKWIPEDIVARENGFAYLYPLSTTLIPCSEKFRDVNVTLKDTLTIARDELRSVYGKAEKMLFQAETMPGSALFSNRLEAVLVKTISDDAVLAVKGIKTEGKKLKQAADWFKAYRDRADSITGLLKFR